MERRSGGHSRAAYVKAVVGHADADHVQVQIRQIDISQLVEGNDGSAIRLPDVAVRGGGKSGAAEGHKVFCPTLSIVGGDGKLAGVEASVQREIADHGDQIIEIAG